MQSPLPPSSDTMQTASSFVSVHNKDWERERCRIFKQSLTGLIGLFENLHSSGKLTNGENPCCPSWWRALKMTVTHAWPERLFSPQAKTNKQNLSCPYLRIQSRMTYVSEVWNHTQIMAHAGACGLSGSFPFTECFLRLVRTDPSNFKSPMRQNQLCSS